MSVTGRTSGQNLENPECPNCGSEHAIRIGSAMLPGDGYDVRASGVFGCGHCRNEYQFLKLLVEQVFSPKAPCPTCGSFLTKAIKTGVVKRYHVCLNPQCRTSFKTLRPPNERLSRSGLSSDKN